MRNILATVNAIYARTTDIQFVESKYSELEDPHRKIALWYVQQLPWYAMDEDRSLLYAQIATGAPTSCCWDNDAINVYLVNQIGRDRGELSTWGFARPDEYALVAIAVPHRPELSDSEEANAEQDARAAKTLAHELGHSLGLAHTFEGNNRCNNCGGGADYVDDLGSDIDTKAVPIAQAQAMLTERHGADAYGRYTTQRLLNNVMAYHRQFDIAALSFSCDQRECMNIAVSTHGRRSNAVARR